MVFSDRLLDAIFAIDDVWTSLEGVVSGKWVGLGGTHT